MTTNLFPFRIEDIMSDFESEEGGALPPMGANSFEVSM
jgi:hypothetical protein